MVGANGFFHVLLGPMLTNTISSDIVFNNHSAMILDSASATQCICSVFGQCVWKATSFITRFCMGPKCQATILGEELLRSLFMHGPPKPVFIRLSLFRSNSGTFGPRNAENRPLREGESVARNPLLRITETTDFC